MKLCKYCGRLKPIYEFPSKGAKCKECVAIYKKEYQIKNSSRIKERKSLYYQDHKDDIKQKQKRRYEENREYILEQCKLYRIKNRESCIERDKKKYIKRKNDPLFLKKEYQKYKNSILARHNEWRERNKEHLSQYRKMSCKDISDWYALSLLRHELGSLDCMDSDDIEQLIVLKRKSLTLKRIKYGFKRSKKQIDDDK